MSALLPLSRAFIARLDAAAELGRRFFQGDLRLGAPGVPPEEFEGHRPYSPGDDVRWIDWNLFARLAEPFVKVFSAEEESEVVLAVDVSPSMSGGTGGKQRAAAAATAALARLALVSGHAVRVGRYAGRLLDVHGPWRSPNELAAVQQRLIAAPPAGAGTDLEAALEVILARRGRMITVVAITDGFQAAPLVPALTRALALGARRIAVVRVIDPGDMTPPLRGHTILIDAEGPDRRTIFADRALEAAAHQRIAGHFQLLGEACARLGAPLYRLGIDAEFEQAFIGMLRQPPAVPVPGAA